MPEPSLAPPEPDLTPKELIERAVALRPKLIERQAEVEERTYYSEAMHEAFLDAGFYRMYVPRRYGGYEFDMPTFMRVTLELARGCPSTAWCLSLASAHALQIGSWFPEDAQEEIFGDGDFRCASVAAPVGPATRTDDGWEINGQVGYASGVPYSTHYMGQAMMPGFDPAGPPPEMLLFVAPRDQWTMIDDWGWSMGLKGSGSHSIRFDGTKIPANWGLENTFMVDVDVSNGTPGLKLHGNPLYAGRALGGFTMTLAAAWIGAAYNALDDFENNVRTKMTPLPPFIPRMYDPDYQRFFGGAMGKLAMVEAALFNCADQHMELCRRSAEEGIPFTYGDDQRLGCIAREAYIHASQTMEEFIFGPAGSSATRAGERMERMFRDIAMAAGHRNTLLRDWAFRELACEQLGVPRDPASGNRQMVPSS